MFPIEPGKSYAVITGDIIKSSSLEAPDRQRLPEQIHEISCLLTEWLGDEVLTPISIFGGDSWQILLANPGDALRVALFIRASLLASPLNVDTRLAIAVGSVDFVPESGIEEADGEAFRLSGRLINDEMDRRTIAFAHPDAEVTARWDLVCRLIDALIQTSWNANRARALTGEVRGLIREQTGQLWSPPISRQSVNRHLKEAGWTELEHACEGMINYWRGEKEAL